ncbi:MAG: YkvA family protein [Candidatus Rokuibacteriota bacterium]
MRALLRALPDIIRTIGSLAIDPVLPRAAKIALAASLVYLVSPIDLIPDFIPVLGHLDDVFVAAILVDGMLNFVNRGLVLKYWPGRPESLERIARAARLLAAWVPRRLKLRIFSGP